MFAPLNARAGARRGHAGRASTRGRAARRSRRHVEPAARARGRHRASRRAARRRSGDRRAARGRRRSHDRARRRRRRARPARHLLHERQHRRAEGRRALAPRELAAHVSRARPRPPGGGGHRVHVPAVPHGGLDDRARRVAGAAARCTSSRRPTPRRCSPTAARHRAARLYCIPAVWARILEHGVGGYDLSSAARSRHRHVGDAARAARRAPRRAAPHRHARLLRLDRSRPGRSQLGDADLFRKPGSVGSRSPASR